MSDSNERPDEGTPPPSSSEPGRQDGPVAGKPEPKPEALPSDQADSNGDPREALKRDVEKYRLTAAEKAEILAELPPPEERERMYRELMENGGLSFEECFGDLLKEFEGQP